MLYLDDDKILNQLWVEKYRPRSVNDMVLDEDYKNTINKYLESGEVSHVALFGSPGCGKTCLARILINALIKSDMDVLTLNGSESTGVDTMRTMVLNFLKAPPYQSKLKIVYIDEFDYTTQNAQAVLRNMMETYADNGRFIVTGNYISKIIDPLLSRFTVFEMKSLPKDYIKEYATKILKEENVKYDEDTVNLVIDNFSPDVRKIINTIQQNVVNGVLKKIDSKTIITSENKICGLIKNICDDMGTSNRETTMNRIIPEILTILNSGSEPDYLRIYEVLSNDSSFPLWGKIKVNQYCNMHGSCVSPRQHFMAMIYDIIYAGITLFDMIKRK